VTPVSEPNITVRLLRSVSYGNESAAPSDGDVECYVIINKVIRIYFQDAPVGSSDVRLAWQGVLGLDRPQHSCFVLRKSLLTHPIRKQAATYFRVSLCRIRTGLQREGG
jgi:hypothetical protein